MTDAEKEAREWIVENMKSFKNVRSDDYHNWKEEYGNYFFDCLSEIKPRIAEEIAGTSIDPRNGKGFDDALFQYVVHLWEHDSDAGTN